MLVLRKGDEESKTEKNGGTLLKQQRPNPQVVKLLLVMMLTKTVQIHE
jgi:hypothetical protein